MKASAGFLEDDFDKMDKALNKKTVYRLEDVKDRIERVAFDVVRFKDSEGFDKLWIVEQRDGQDVIVATYDEDSGKIEAKASWEASADRSGKFINVFYNGEPVKKFASSLIDVLPEESHVVCRYLPRKLADDADFRKKFLADLPQAEKEDLFSKHPELKG